MTSEAQRPTPIPTSPPKMQSRTDSVRNCERMRLPRAPTAIRSPISRVRSVTLTSIMFIIPTPPTTSESIATISSRVVISPLVAVIVLSISDISRMEKSSSAPGAMLWRRRRTSQICAIASGTCSGVLAETVIWSILLKRTGRG